MKQEIWECIIKRLTDNETELSASALTSWLNENPANEQEFEQVKTLWFLTGKIPTKQLNGFNHVEDQIQQKLNPPVNHKWWYSIAAATIAVLVLCTVIFVQQRKEPKVKLASLITKKANPGEILKLIMPDSSVIWLNSGSEISFSERFTSEDKRIVSLKGEAYFDVKHDKAHPFIVKSATLTTTVYGTSFNVRAYAKEKTVAISVNSGKVGVNENKENAATQFLLPKNQLVYQIQDQSFIKKTIALEDVNSWINGELIFDQTPLEDVLLTISRKFKVKINAEKLSAKGCSLTAKFKNKSLENVLETLRLVMDIKTQQINGTIYLEGGSACK